jgi:hypothetical protein
VKTSLAFLLSGIAVVVSCGGQVVDRSNGTAGSSKPAGIGGSVVVGPAPGTGGGSIGVGGTIGGAGGSIGIGGGTGSGGMETGGGTVDAGGAAGCVPYTPRNRPEPGWAVPTVEAACNGITLPPAPVRWLDDFEGGNTFDPLLVPGWEVYADVYETITGGLGPAATTPLTGWGSHDPASFNGMEMQGYRASCPGPGENSWGTRWQYETALGDGGRRATLDLSPYTGMVIWARLAGPPGKGNMVVAFPTPNTTTWDGGNECLIDAGILTTCDAEYQVPAKVTKACWSPIVIPFAALKVPYGNTPPGGFDKAHVFGVELQFSAWGTAIKANWPVDVIVDDIYFY